jgi:hypothetical protein
MKVATRSRSEEECNCRFPGAAHFERGQPRCLNLVGVGIMIAHNPSTDPDKRHYRIRLLP